MAVFVDEQPLATESSGLDTLGQVLNHLQSRDRLVVQVLIDGESPDLEQMEQVRALPIAGRTIFIETVDPRAMASEVLGDIEQHLVEAEDLKSEAVDLLQVGQHAKAMEKLSGCFTTWQHAQQSIAQVGQLLKIDMQSIKAQQQTLAQVLTEVTEQLRQIKSALEDRDFVLLADILAYQSTETNAQWRSAVSAMRQAIC